MSTNSLSKFIGMLKQISLVLLIGLLAWSYKAITPPPPRICGTPGGPPVTAPRIKLRDGRNLAYQEYGVVKDAAKHKLIFLHGFHCYRNDIIVKNLSPDFFEELSLQVVTIDRPGYGQSDPDPKRTPKSLALDIEELADQLGLGTKFYVGGFSMGGQAVWGCLKYIPHRLAGATLLAPAINFWWAGLPANLSKEAYYLQPQPDQWVQRVSHHVPWLTYWWNTQRFFPAASFATLSPEVFSKQDLEIISKAGKNMEPVIEVTQQGEYESLHRDLIVGFGEWEFEPTDLENPFVNNEGSVHLWQGSEDKLVHVILQRHIAQKLPWIKYHELPGSGHLFPCIPALSEVAFRTLLIGEK